MAGRLVGEVGDHARQLYRSGVTRNAFTALLLIAEGCREPSRIGPCARERIAEALDRTEKTASRAIAVLIGLGLVTIVSAGGGRGRARVVTTYHLADLGEWLRQREAEAAYERRDTEMSPGSSPGPESAGHPGVPPEPPGESPPDHRRDICDRSAGHPDVPPPVVPVEDLSGSPTDVTTGPREAAAAWRPSPRPRSRSTSSPQPSRPGPGPSHRPTVEAARRVEERAAVEATCPHGCVGGERYGWPCDHRPRHTGRDLVFAELAAIDARRRQRAGQATPGRHRIPDRSQAEFARAAS